MIMSSGIRLVVTSLSHIIGKRDKSSEEMILRIISEIDSNIEIRDMTIHNYGVGSIWVDLILSIQDKTLIPAIQNDIKNKINIKTTIEWENYYEQ